MFNNVTEKAKKACEKREEWQGKSCSAGRREGAGVWL